MGGVVNHNDTAMAEAWPFVQQSGAPGHQGETRDVAPMPEETFLVLRSPGALLRTFDPGCRNAVVDFVECCFVQDCSGYL